MPVSILGCNYDRSLNELASYKVGKANAVTGSYKLRWQVEMASACGPIEALTQGQSVSASPQRIPQMWATYAFLSDTDAHSYLQELSVDLYAGEKSRRFFLVTGKYDPTESGMDPDLGGAPINATVDPLLRKPVFWWDRELSTKLHTVDKNGDALKTFANGLYSDLVESEHTKSIQVVEFNVAGVKDVNEYIRSYDDSVNVSNFTLKGTTYPARTVNIREVTGTPPISEGSSTFCTVKMRIAFAPLNEVWDVKLPEMGQTYFTKTSGAYDLDAQGYRKRGNSGSLVPLETDGTRRADTAPILSTPWRVKREVDYSPLATIFNR